MSINRAAIVSEARRVFFSTTSSGHADFYKAVDTAVDAVLAEVAKHNTPDKVAYYKMGERKPTKEDAKPSGRVLGYNPEEKCWYAVGYQAAPAAYEYWTPMPAPIISEDNAAREKLINLIHEEGLGLPLGSDATLRRVWDAALAHRDKSKP